MSAFTASHWGVYEIEDPMGASPRLRAFASDPDPSPIGLYMASPAVARNRIERPAIRKGWLEHGPGRRADRRACEPFVEVEWDRALDLAASELARVRDAYGNRSIFGGSYGWASAGRFHHAQSQLHRFLNCTGGYVRHVDSYSLGAARALMPYVVATVDELMEQHNDWNALARHCQVFVTFGGVPLKNAQINPGGTAEHRVRKGLDAMARAGVRFVNISPTRRDLHTGAEFEWWPIRPNTDTALILALSHTVLAEGRHDRAFLARYCVGFDRYAAYLLGKDDGVPKTAAWASAITNVPEAAILELGHAISRNRTMLNIAWSLQRAHHGEQPFWALINLACMLGQIGTPGGGFGLGYGAENLIGSPHAKFAGPTFPQGRNPVTEFIPVARVADMLLHPGEEFTYCGTARKYPDIRLVYWAGGNPFHHHQDLNRFVRAWRKPETVIVHEQFWNPIAKAADIVFPATTSLEREDIFFARREPFVIAMKPASKPCAASRDDYAIFCGLAERIGCVGAFSEGLDARGWLRRMYEQFRGQAALADAALPDFDAFWECNILKLPANSREVVMLSDFRDDPAGHPLKTPTGRIELYSETIAGYGYHDCPGHPCWIEPAEWLGAAEATRFPLHLISDQPVTRLHSQLDHSPHSIAGKHGGRERVTLHPDDAPLRGLCAGDVARLFNARGSCAAAVAISDDIRPGVVKLSTGAWFDPMLWSPDNPLEKHGNPNVLTADRPASSFSQGCSAQTCLVQVEKFEGELPPVTAFERAELIRERTR
jgi:biotin/methionine sulfoxide reductase